MRKLAALCAVITASISLLACGGGGDETAEVSVTLKEWEVNSSPSEVSPGTVLFSVTNGGSRQHQLLVIKSDLPPTQLPTVDVLLDESKVIIAASIELVQPGESASIEIELFPGKYLLICNLIDRPATGPADPHYLNGMVASFLVLDD